MKHPYKVQFALALTLAFVLSSGVIAVDNGGQQNQSTSDWTRQGLILDCKPGYTSVEDSVVLYNQGIYKMWYSVHYGTLDAEIYYAMRPQGAITQYRKSRLW